jgi:hypothetical protein
VRRCATTEGQRRRWSSQSSSLSRAGVAGARGQDLRTQTNDAPRTPAGASILRSTAAITDMLSASAPPRRRHAFISAGTWNVIDPAPIDTASNILHDRIHRRRVCDDVTVRRHSKTDRYPGKPQSSGSQRRDQNLTHVIPLPPVRIKNLGRVHDFGQVIMFL